MGAGWVVRHTTDGSRHVLPLGDSREHKAEACWCGVTEEDGVVVHNSADGREARERGEGKPS